MKLIRFLKSKTFWANLLLAILTCILIFWGVNAWLDSYTRHGENIKVPELSRLAYEEATAILAENELVPAILDTSEYHPAYPRGSVLNQYPEPGDLVKKGRTIMLTINPLEVQKIEIPDLIEKTKRRAIYDLESKGFEVGEFTYVPYLGKDVVVDVKVNGELVKAKEKFKKGTVVNLILGQGLGSTRVSVPNLHSLSEEEAEKKIREASLNVGSINIDEVPQDTIQPVVYRQYPSGGSSARMGTEINIWLTRDYTKIPHDSLNLPQSGFIDSLANDYTE